MDQLPLLFLLLIISANISSSSQLNCPEVIIEQWENITSEVANLKLELDLDRLTGEARNCSFQKETEVEVFALKTPKDYKCSSLFDGYDKGNVRRFFDNHDTPKKYVLSNEKRKVTFEFIFGHFIFSIGNRHDKKYCTQTTPYNAVNDSKDRMSAIEMHNQCLEDQAMPEFAAGPPFWRNNICSLEITTFQLSKCYLITNYTEAILYLVEVDKENKTCDINPEQKSDLVSRYRLFPINQDTKIKDISFANLIEGKNYCIFISMWKTYPICNPGSTDLRDKGLNPCYYFSNMTFRCPQKPPLKKQHFVVILSLSGVIILLVCAFLMVKFRKRVLSNRYLRTDSTAPHQISLVSRSTTEDQNLKIYLLYYPNNEVSDEDIQQIKDKNGSFCSNLNEICTANKNVTVIDIVDKIRLDEIQDTSGIEMELSNGMAKCALFLTPSAKKLFDHIDSGGDSPNPLDQDLVDGSERGVILPLFKYLRDFQNANGNTYRTIGCVRFDRNGLNDGDDIKINPLQRMSLPSDGREFAEWAIDNS